MLGAAVVDGFRTGDESAVRAVYDTYGRLVFSVAMRVLGDRSLAEEATQQTFVQAWRNAAQFDGDREMGPWLATIVRRVAIDIHRREALKTFCYVSTVERRCNVSDWFCFLRVF